MFLPVQFKPDTTHTEPEKFILVVENYISSELCQELKDFLDKNPSTHRRGSKNPDICTAQFFTCLMNQPEKPIYSILQNLLTRYNSRHQFKLMFMEPIELKRYTEGDEFSVHNDNYLGTEYGLDRKINIIVQLSNESEYEGGDLSIGYKNAVVVPKTIGTAVIFPANYFHTVSKITNGSRYSLISHIWGPEFK